MADYVSIIGRAVAALPENTPENRETVYAKARATIDRKLRAIEPAPPEAAIAAQLEQLEAAIRQVETEQLAAEAADEIRREAAAASDDSTAVEDAATATEDTQEPEQIAVPPANPPHGFIDDVILIDGIGEKTVAALQAEGVTGISQIAAMDDRSLAKLTEKIGLPNFENTQEWKAQARSMLSGELPRSRTDRDRLAKFKAELGESADEEHDPTLGAETGESQESDAGDQTSEIPRDENDDAWNAEARTSETDLSALDQGAELSGVDDARHDELHGGEAEPPVSITEIEGEPTKQEAFAEDDFSKELRPRRRGGAGKVIGWLVVLGLLGSAAYGAYIYREELGRAANEAGEVLRALISGDSSDEPTESGDGAASEEAIEPDAEPVEGESDAEAATEAEKDTARLGSDTEEPVTEDPITLVPGVGEEQPRLVEPPASQSSEGSSTETAEEPATVEIADGQENDPDTGSSAGDSATAENSASTEGTTQQPVVTAGETAYLYEEAGTSGSASRDEGNIVWRLEQEPPEPDFPAEAVIKGVMEIPGRGLVMNLTIKRNVDAALPASHIIELLFSAPPEFSGGNIDEVARFVIKATEQARGESLVGVPARIDTGFFLIALNNLPQAQETNLNLLASGNWVDIPVRYLTGRRGLVTFEKGPSGSQIFERALEDWQNR